MGKQVENEWEFDSLYLNKIIKIKNINMEKIVKIVAVRDDYEINRCTEDALSVEEVIAILGRFPKDAKMVMSFDNNYMFGAIREDMFREVTIETREEEDIRNALLACEDEIYMLEDEQWCGYLDMVQKLSDILGAEVSYYDGGIDDGADGNEDEYVMKACFECKAFGKDIFIKIYYGNVTETIGYIEIDY